MSSDNRRRPPSSNADLFDEMWSSMMDTATELTRSLVGLPMFYRHADQNAVQTIFAEPGILSPQIITFHLDRDVDSIVGPFRFETRPVSVFDVFSQGWGPTRGTGMMFLFGSPVENTKWLMAPGLKVTANSMFRPWGITDDWIRKGMGPPLFC